MRRLAKVVQWSRAALKENESERPVMVDALLILSRRSVKRAGVKRVSRGVVDQTQHMRNKRENSQSKPGWYGWCEVNGP
jgi:hypothetical protein